MEEKESRYLHPLCKLQIEFPSGMATSLFSMLTFQAIHAIVRERSEWILYTNSTSFVRNSVTDK